MEYNQGFYNDGYNTDPRTMQQSGGYGQQTGYYQPAAAAPPQQYHQQGYEQNQGWDQSTAYDSQQQGYGMTPTSAAYAQPYVQPGYTGDVMDVDPAPGTLGQMAPRDSMSFGRDSAGFEDEPPLLEELGIDFSLIKENTMSVLNPLKPADAGALSTTDLAGPLLFCLMFGGLLLLTGKVHFGYIYGVGLLGCTSLYIVLNLMSIGGVSIGCVVSVLGYCLLPMVFLSALSVVISLNGVIGMPLAFLFICWCSYSASKLFVSVLAMQSQQLLVAYPCALVYGIFALLTVF